MLLNTTYFHKRDGSVRFLSPSFSLRGGGEEGLCPQLRDVAQGDFDRIRHKCTRPDCSFNGRNTWENETTELLKEGLILEPETIVHAAHFKKRESIQHMWSRVCCE